MGFSGILAVLYEEYVWKQLGFKSTLPCQHQFFITSFFCNIHDLF